MADLKTVDSKKMLKALADKKTKMRHNDRKAVEIIEDTKFYRKGNVLTPHVTWADELIKQKIAKEVK